MRQMLLHGKYPGVLLFRCGKENTGPEIIQSGARFASRQKAARTHSTPKRISAAPNLRRIVFQQPCARGGEQCSHGAEQQRTPQ